MYKNLDKLLPPVESPDIALPVPRVFIAKLQIEEAVIEMLKSMGETQGGVLAGLREPHSTALSIVKSYQWDEYSGNERPDDKSSSHQNTPS